MKIVQAAASAVVAMIVIAGGATAQCKKQPIEALAKAVAEGFEAKTLSSLDSQKPYAGRIRIVIEHSLAGDNDKDRFVVRSFLSLAKAEAWLKSREHDEMRAARAGRFKNARTEFARSILTAAFSTIRSISKRSLTVCTTRVLIRKRSI